MKFSISHTTIYLLANRFYNLEKGEEGCYFGFAISVRHINNDSSFDTIHNSARLIKLIKCKGRMRLQVMSRKQRLQKII